MRTQTEALKLALEALEKVWSPTYVDGCSVRKLGEEAISAIREVLEQQESEPIAWMTTNEDGDPAMLLINFAQANGPRRY